MQLKCGVERISPSFHPFDPTGTPAVRLNERSLPMPRLSGS